MYAAVKIEGWPDDIGGMEQESNQYALEVPDDTKPEVDIVCELVPLPVVVRTEGDTVPGMVPDGSVGVSVHTTLVLGSRS